MRSGVQKIPVPIDSSLHDLVQDYGAYADCFTVRIAGIVSFSEYVEAFYTSPIFKAERLILRVFAGRPSTDQQAHELATGARDTFAVWRVDCRSPTELLLKEGRTCSWLRIVPPVSGEDQNTVLMFGSAVFSGNQDRGTTSQMGLLFRLLIGPHLIYSRLLLAAARRQLMRTRVQPNP